MGTLEFPNLGKHCSVESCQLIDFLPFNCDKCGQVYCLEHRSYSGHSCSKANTGDVTVIICPLCAKSIRLASADEDADVAWNRHISTAGCDPSNYAKVTKKKRCPVRGCKEALTVANTVRCRECTRETCLRHRFGPDHQCPGKGAPPGAAESYFGSSLMGTFQRTTAGIAGAFQGSVGTVGGAAGAGAAKAGRAAAKRGSASSAVPSGGSKPGGGAGTGRGAASGRATDAAAPNRTGGNGTGTAKAAGRPRQPTPQQHDPTNTVRGTANRRQEEFERSRGATGGATAAQRQVPGGNDVGRGQRPGEAGQAHPSSRAADSTGTQSYGGPSGGEECPQCSTRFADVAELIMHVETTHLGGSTNGGPRAPGGFGLSGEGGREVCPKCRREFADVGALVRHVEATHVGEGSDSKCAIS